MKKENAKEFNKELNRIKDLSYDFDDIVKQFIKICNFYEKNIPHSLKQ